MKDFLKLQEDSRLRAEELLPEAGINKKREICRLIFEICKRDGLEPKQLLNGEKIKNFEQAKKLLLALRYPLSYGKAPA